MPTASAPEQRPNSAARGYGGRWPRFRRHWLARNPLCVHCAARGIVTPATEVDHILPMADGGGRFDENNLQSLCKRCHSRKTVRDRVARRGAGPAKAAGEGVSDPTTRPHHDRPVESRVNFRG